MAERKKAPNMTVTLVHVSERREIQRAWDKKEPAYVHIWMESRTDAHELARGQLEVCKHEDGMPEVFRGDVLCRRPKEVELASRMQREDASYTQLKEAIMAGGRNEESNAKMKLKWQRKPRKPPVVEQDEED